MWGHRQPALTDNELGDGDGDQSTRRDVLGEPGPRLNPDRVDPEPDYTEIQSYGAWGIQSRGLHSLGS